MRRLFVVPTSALCLMFALLLCLPGTTPAGAQQADGAPAHVMFRVVNQTQSPLSGRLLLFLKQGKGDASVEIDEFHPSDTFLSALEIADLAPGQAALLDATQTAFPASFATLKAGDYEAQAVLDTGHTYNYSGRDAADWISPVLALPHWVAGASIATLTLDHHAEENPNRVAALERLKTIVKPGVAEMQEMQSPLLTAFWGKPTFVRAWVILPPAYAAHPQEHFPTVFATHGFGGNLEGQLASGARILDRLQAGTMPPMIWVMLDESCPQGTHEFADSVNDGPWGAALTTEFLPMLERHYRMDARPTGRLLNGHSSGGWATLQLEVNYPQIFGGTWSTSPDPSDFHNFTGPDLYGPHANAYRRPDGSPNPIMRDHGQVLATLQQFSQLEAVLGPYGGQMSSFDWVFSPRSPSGAPMPLFDRVTGDVDPAVVSYWHDHYDLAHVVEANWSTRGPLLKGRIHLIVGTADTFYLNESAKLFEARLQALGAEPHFTYLPDRTHFDLYQTTSADGKVDPSGLLDQIAKEMYAVARPGRPWPAVPQK